MLLLSGDFPCDGPLDSLPNKGLRFLPICFLFPHVVFPAWENQETKLAPTDRLAGSSYLYRLLYFVFLASTLCWFSFLFFLFF